MLSGPGDVSRPRQPQADAADPPSTSGVPDPPASPTTTVLILAAGQGTRMKSGLHKVLHRAAGRSLIQRVLDLASDAGASKAIVVLGYLADQVRAALPVGTETVLQEPQLGTGHAVLVASDRIAATGAERLLVLYGDMALIRPHSLRRLAEQVVGPAAPLALLSVGVVDPFGYGRVVRGPDGEVQALVEEVEASETERAIREVNTGVMLFWTPWLLEHAGALPARHKGEYYLTDLVQRARAQGRRVLAVIADEAEEGHGVNDRQQLAEANRVLWDRKRMALMQSGVTLVDPATTYIDPEVEIEPDVVIHPGCHIQGASRVSRRCEIGPNTLMTDTTVGEESRVRLSVIEGATIGRRVTIGPFSHIRPGAYIEDGVELGNYAEVKGSRIGAGTKMHHFSYVGDAEVGENVNIGAGAITLNYDGRQKHRTTIGDNAFIGSDSLLRAPLNIGAGAFTGAGSVVTKDVPEGGRVAGVPARPLPHRPGDETGRGPGA